MQYSENNSALIFKAVKAEVELYWHMMIMSVVSIKSAVEKETKRTGQKMNIYKTITRYSHDNELWLQYQQRAKRQSYFWTKLRNQIANTKSS